MAKLMCPSCWLNPSQSKQDYDLCRQCSKDPVIYEAFKAKEEARKKNSTTQEQATEDANHAP
jgi:hypothetical protein